MTQVIEHPTTAHTLLTGYPYNAKSSPAEVVRCECGCLAKMEIKGQCFCFDCADDAHEVRML